MREKKEMIMYILDVAFPTRNYESLENRHDLQIELKRLSVKDLMILSLKSSGMNNTQTAFKMGMERHTLGLRLKAIKDKLGF